MILLILLIAISCVLTLYTHEISHVIANSLAGRTIGEIVLYPHYYKDKFYFSRVTSIGPARRLNWVYASPSIKSVLLFFTWAIIFWGTKSLYVLPFAVLEVVDLLWWVKGYLLGPSHTDGSKFRDFYL